LTTDRASPPVETIRQTLAQHDMICLFLDFDGTLLDLAETPDAIAVDGALPDLLARTSAALGGALQVNPHDTRGMALAIQVALTMPLTERIERHAANLAVLRRNDIHSWHERMIGALAATARTAPLAPPAETPVRAAARTRDEAAPVA